MRTRIGPLFHGWTPVGFASFALVFQLAAYLWNEYRSTGSEAYHGAATAALQFARARFGGPPGALELQ